MQDGDDAGDAGEEVQPGGTDESTRMTLVEHLTELRRRVVIALVSVAVAGVVGFIIFPSIIRLLMEPYVQASGQETLIYTDPLEAFLTRLRVAAYSGFAMASPVVLWQVWRFVTPGLHKNERRYAVPMVLSATLAFAVGVTGAYLMLPRALGFFLTIGGEELTPLLSAGRYLSFIVRLLLAVGLVAELPVLVGFLLVARVVTTKQLRAARRWVIVFIVVIAAIATPPDPQTQMIVAVPMYVLYELTILIGRALKR